MIIKYPVLDYQATKLNFEEELRKFNSGKKLGQKIRANHIDLMKKMLGMYSASIYENNKVAIAELGCFDTDKPRTLLTNNVTLARELNVKECTIYRRMERLIEAKMIQKINHGTQRSYEICFKSSLLQVTENQTSSTGLIASCKPQYNLDEITNRIKKTKKGIKIGSEHEQTESVIEVEKPSELLGEWCERNSMGERNNVSETGGGCPAEVEKPEEKNSFSKEFNLHKTLIINIIYAMIIKTFFSNWKLTLPKERDVKNIIWNDYMVHCQTVDQLNKRKVYFEYEVKKFKSFMDRSGFEIWHTPENFLKRGRVDEAGKPVFNFSNTIQWWKEYLDNKRVKQQNIHRYYTHIKPEIKIRKLRKDQEIVAQNKLAEALSRLAKHPDKAQMILDNMKSYFSENVPVSIGQPIINQFVTSYQTNYQNLKN